MKRLAYSGILALTLASVIVAAALLFPTVARSQNPEWMNFTYGGNVSEVAEHGDYLWVGAEGGLTRVHKATGEMTFYNKANSGLPSNSVEALAIDAQGNKWIGTDGGLAKFDGVNWTGYTKSNSGLPDNQV